MSEVMCVGPAQSEADKLLACKSKVMHSHFNFQTAVKKQCNASEWSRNTYRNISINTSTNTFHIMGKAKFSKLKGKS